MIIIRPPESIYQITGSIQNGTFHGRWHFSFNGYHDPAYLSFGALEVFNDDTRSPGAIWPLHPHRDIEVVTYCADGEFRHADDNGEGGVLQKGWVQHTTVGRGMYHSEINNRADIPMRFVQIWFKPVLYELDPFVEQKRVDTDSRTNRLFPLVSNINPDALFIHSEAQVFSSLLLTGQGLGYRIESGHGVYLYVVEGGPLILNEEVIPEFGAARITEEPDIRFVAQRDAELLLVDVLLTEKE